MSMPPTPPPAPAGDQTDGPQGGDDVSLSLDLPTSLAAMPTQIAAPPKDKTPAILVSNLLHQFKAHRALNSVTFHVMPGELHGFVGPNGAGKTTTLKILSTLLPPQAGLVEVNGMSVRHHRQQVRRLIGFMPDHFGMYRQMTVYEYLDFFGAAYGLSPKKRSSVIADVLALTDMDGRQDDLIKGLSKGMGQRVSLARVLINDPQILLLDEPAAGLDPRARIELMAILRELQQLGKTVFISSHILSELATLCDSVTIIDRGQTRYCGPMSGLLRHAGEHIKFELRLAEAVAGLDTTLREIKGVEQVDVTQDGRQLMLDAHAQDHVTNDILQAVMSAGGVILTFRERERQLDEAFMELTQAGVREQ